MFHLKKAIDFITKSLTENDRLFFELNEIEFDNPIEPKNNLIYNIVIDYIGKNLI